MIQGSAVAYITTSVVNFMQIRMYLQLIRKTITLYSHLFYKYTLEHTVQKCNSWLIEKEVSEINVQ